jgi:hypothetical protein
MAYSTMRSAISLSSVTGSTFTAKLQNACTSTAYPEGTVFDCSGFTSNTTPSQTITGTITITRPGITLLFSEGDFIMKAAGDVNMFNIQAPNVTIIGVSRSAKDSLSTNGSTRFILESPNTGYHVYTRPTGPAWSSWDSLTIMNCDFVGVKSIYTSVGGTVSYSTVGAGGIMLAEGNVDQPNSNLNNVMISEVLVSGAKQHGVMIYGGMASKLQNVRVRNAAGHGFYIAGSTTSTTLDACYASGNYLAGFCINDTTYSTLTSCASDSNGVGYWMRNANSVTLNSCGAEVCEVRSNIPNNLGITIPNSAGTMLVNDIGSDNVNFIKGTSFLFTGGSNITGTSCYSKDPTNREDETTYLSKYSAHIFVTSGTTKVNMDNFKRQGLAPVKYKYRLEDAHKIQIDDTIYSFDPLNPSETSDVTSMNMPVADVLDQGTGNIFGDLEDSTSFTGRRALIGDSSENYRIENLQALSRFTLPTFEVHPANPQAGTIYFNTTLNKLYMYSGSAWFDTCCTTAPTPAPECVFPNGGIQLISYINDGVITGGGGAKSFIRLGDKLYAYGPASSTTLNNTSISSVISMFDYTNQTIISLLSEDDLQPIVNYAGTSFVLSTNFAYSTETNSFYFTASNTTPNNTQYNVSDSQAAGSSQFVIKFNLSTNQIDQVYSLLDLSIAQSEDAYNVFGGGCQVYVFNGQLYVVRRATSVSPQSGYIVVTTFNLNSLAIGTSYTGAAQDKLDMPVSDLNFNIKYNDANPDEVLQSYFWFPQGSSESVYGSLNLETGMVTMHVYDATPVPFTTQQSQTITYSESTDTMLIADAGRQTLYEVDFNHNILDTWSLGVIGHVTEKVINSKRIFVFYKRTLSFDESSVNTSFEAYNVTDDYIIGSIPQSVGGNPSQYSLYITKSLPIILNGEPNNFIYILTSNTTIKGICAPYAV